MAATKGNGASKTQAKKMSKIEQENQRLIEEENQRHDEEIRRITARNDKKTKKTKTRSRSNPVTQSQRVTRSKGMSETETSDDHQSEDDEEAKLSQNGNEDPNSSHNSNATLVDKTTNNNTINDEDPNPDFSDQRQSVKENADEMINVITKLKELTDGESKEEDFKGKLLQIIETISQSFVKLNNSYSLFIDKMEKQCKTGMINRLAYEAEYPKMMKKKIDNKIKKMLSGPELNKKKATENLIARREIDEDANTHRQVTLTGVQEITEKIAPDQYKKGEAEKALKVIVETCDQAEEYWETPEWHKFRHIREARVFRPDDYDINDIVVQTSRMQPDKPGRHGLNQGTERTYKRRIKHPDGTEEWVDFEEKRYQKLVATLRTNKWADYVNACQLCVIMVANKKQIESGLQKDFKKRRIHPKYSIRAQHAADKLYKAAQEDERRRVRLKIDKEAQLNADEITQDEYDKFMKEPEDSPDWLKRVMCEKSLDGLWWPKLVLCKYKDGKSKRYIRDQEELRYKKVLEKRSLAPGAENDLIDGQQY